jgi:NAD(P)H-dependent FMN reductase
MRSPFVGKPVLMIAASTGRGGARKALDHLRQVLESMDASPLSTEVSVARAAERFASGTPDDDLRAELRSALDQLPLPVRQGASSG